MNKRQFALSVAFFLVSAGAMAAGDCQLIGSVCTVANKTFVIDGVPITKDCWRWEDKYQCRNPDLSTDCQALIDKGCAQIGGACSDVAQDGSCTTYTRTMQCPVKLPEVKESVVCESALCQDGSGCFDTTRPLDKDFGQAAAIMEASREAGIYGIDPDKIEIFKGYMEKCTVKMLGGASIKNCCASAGGGGGFTNYAVIGLTAKAAYAVGKEEIKAGSKYMYDALFSSQDSSLVTEGLSAASGGLSVGASEGVAAQSGTSFGAYGFQFSYSSVGGFSYVGFDPYSFAFSVAMAIVTEWLACEQTEQLTQMKRGQNLCVYIDSYCSTKVLGVCLEKTEQHCCFPSVLAKIINRQGRAQLGMAMDECGGFTQEQIQAIDFSVIDFSEFIATISPTTPAKDGTTSSVTDTVNKKVNDYYGR